MAYEGPPAITFTWVPGQLFLWYYFTPDMDISLNPPDTRWHIAANGAAFTWVHDNWTDNHNMEQHWHTDFNPAFQTLTLGYSPIHPDLRVHYGTAYPPWDPIVVPSV